MATQAAAWREQGNACMAAGDHVEAMKCYSQALTTTPKDASLFSNRSFAFLRLGLSARALSDAENAIRHRPEWPKAWFRKAEALAHARLHELAMASYRTGLSLDPLDTHLQAKASHTHSLFSFFLFTCRQSLTHPISRPQPMIRMYQPQIWPNLTSRHRCPRPRLQGRGSAESSRCASPLLLRSASPLHCSL